VLFSTLSHLAPTSGLRPGAGFAQATITSQSGDIENEMRYVFSNRQCPLIAALHAAQARNFLAVILIGVFRFLTESLFLVPSALHKLAEAPAVDVVSTQISTVPLDQNIVGKLLEHVGGISF